MGRTPCNRNQLCLKHVGCGGYSLNLSWHFLFHMVRSLQEPTSLLAGVGRAMLENGLELMQMRGISFFREGRWLSCTRPNTSSRHSMGKVLPRSLEIWQVPCWTSKLSHSRVAEAGTAAGELTWEQRCGCDSSDSGTDAADASVVWGRGSCRPLAECCHCKRGPRVNTVGQTWKNFILYSLIFSGQLVRKQLPICKSSEQY